MSFTMKPYIQTFYDGEFRKIFSKNSFRAFLKKYGLPNFESMNAYWLKNAEQKYYYDEMQDDLISLYELRLADLYKQFEACVDQLLNNSLLPYNPDQIKAGDYDYILLNNLRISRQKNSKYPQYFLRRDAITPCIDYFDEWVEVEGSDATKAKILDIHLGTPVTRKHGEDEIIHNVFKLATHSLFRSEFPNHNYLSGKANLKWAKLRLSGLTIKDCEFIKEDNQTYNKCVAESIRFSHVAGLLGYIYERKHKAKVNEQNKALKLKVECIYQELFYVEHFDYLENVLQKGCKQYQKIMFLEFIKQNLSSLQFWQKDSPNKLFYAVYFNYTRKENELNTIPMDYFSYHNMIAENGNKDLWTDQRFLFPNKKSMKNAFKMNIAAFAALFPDGGSHVQYKENVSKQQSQIDENAWRILTHWLSCVDKPASISHEDISKIKSMVERLFLGQISTKTVEKFPIAVNLIYQLTQEPISKLGEVKAKLSDYLDYIEGFELAFLQNNQVVKTRRKNIHTLDTKTTLKSLDRKSRNWHRMLELYNQCELLRRGEDYKKSVYENLAELSFLEDGVSFTVLRNRYELLMEGVDMRHCVATYHAKIKKGIYAVMSLKRPNPLSEGGIDRATLGLKLSGNVVSLDQCEGIYHAKISPELRVIVDRVIEKLNIKTYLLFNEDTAPIRMTAV